MNFDFSDDVIQMRGEAARVLRGRLPPGALRRWVNSGEPDDQELWASLGEMGWLGVSVPERFGGSELGYETLCMLAEEIGRVLAPVPFSSSVYLVTEALLLFGSEAQKSRWLPQLADGSVVGAFALAEGPGEPSARAVASRFAGGKLSGTKRPVFDAARAGLFIVAAQAEGEVGLFLVEGREAAVAALRSLEAAPIASQVSFHDTQAEALEGATNWSAIERLLQRAAVLFAFEQVGGAQGALDMAVAYAQDRFAFGRPIGSFQAIKHQLADVYVATELARSNAYFGAWALGLDAPELPLAAATARVAAIEAFGTSAAQNIQTHGGMGFTWDSECHLYYRRAKRLAGQVGSVRYWRNQLIDGLVSRNAA